MLQSYVALDVETANNFRRSICAIGLAKFIDGELVDTYYSLVDPQEDFQPGNVRVHKLTKEDVVDAPIFPEVYKFVLDFIGDFPIVAHNASFDISALRSVCEKYNLNFPTNEWYCSKKKAERTVQEPSYGIEWLAYRYNIELEHHHALSDAIACGRLFQMLPEPELIYQIAFTLQNQPPLQIDNKLNGAYFCFTGSPQVFTKNEAKQLATAHGAIVQDNVNKKTEYVIFGEFRPQELANGGTGKIKKAYQLRNEGQKIEILSISDFLQLLSEE